MIDDMNEEDGFEDFFENDKASISDMMRMVVAQQNIALGLTKLVLEHCDESSISKEEVFQIYNEACDVLKEQNAYEA